MEETTTENETFQIDSEINEENHVEWWEHFENQKIKYTYLYDDRTGEQMFRFDNYVPDPHEIGLKFKSGNYKLIIKFYVGEELKTKTVRFSVAKSYDSIVVDEEENELSGFEEIPDIGTSIANGIVGAFEGIFKSLSPVLPELMKMFKPEKDPTIGEIMGDVMRGTVKNNMDFMKSTNKMMTETIQEMTLNTGALFTPNNLQQEEDEEEEGSSPMSMMFNMAKAQLEPLMPQLIAGHGADIIAKAKENPLVQQVLSNEEAMKEIESWVFDEFGFDALVIVKGLLNS